MILKFARPSAMVVCACAGISERKLRAAIAKGAGTLKEIERHCGAGGGCGACRPLIRECLKECRLAAAERACVPAPHAATELAPA